jgi:hypothetical protein
MSLKLNWTRTKIFVNNITKTSFFKKEWGKHLKEIYENILIKANP